MLAAVSTHDKALQLNMDTAKYGTFAEIGAGQEVARWFFRVGGAAGTVAKTISAYDMAVSDVDLRAALPLRQPARLQAMLQYEIDAAARAAGCGARRPEHVLRLRGHRRHPQLLASRGRGGVARHPLPDGRARGASPRS